MIQPLPQPRREPGTNNTLNGGTPRCDISAHCSPSCCCAESPGAATAGPTEAPNGTADAPTTATPRRKRAHLPNAVQLHPRVISGGLPEGDAAFAELEQLGVKTIISVDGAKPDVQAAARHGLRYVHLPHGYDGIPEERGRELAKAVRELDGPIYIHCHHGKHRSPAAATVACVSTGLLPANEAVAVLKLAGTSPNYRGLYESAERPAFGRRAAR
ncbi:MAG: hypothetical protein R3C10_02145 [Pirellulales bacterium]